MNRDVLRDRPDLKRGVGVTAQAVGNWRVRFVERAQRAQAVDRVRELMSRRISRPEAPKPAPIAEFTLIEEREEPRLTVVAPEQSSTDIDHFLDVDIARTIPTPPVAA